MVVGAVDTNEYYHYRCQFCEATAFVKDNTLNLLRGYILVLT